MSCIKKFRDGIGFRGWKHFDDDCGTAIRWQKAKPGLFGVRIVRSFGQFEGIQFGLWWAIDLSLIAVPQSRFKPDAKSPIVGPSAPRGDLGGSRTSNVARNGGAE